MFKKINYDNWKTTDVVTEETDALDSALSALYNQLVDDEEFVCEQLERVIELDTIQHERVRNILLSAVMAKSYGAGAEKFKEFTDAFYELMYDYIMSSPAMLEGEEHPYE